MDNKIKEAKEVLEQINAKSDESLGMFRKLIDNCAMEPEKVAKMIDNTPKADMIHPDLKNVEGMSSQDFAAIYKEMAEDIKVNPEKYEAHTKATGMTADELSLLFAQINGVVERYPEVWESQEKAQMLNPKNLSILVHALKNEE
ncbi:MAG: hypothetical protein Q4A65_00055 [Bacillota bacterium]|nr:hypothetical protein [Bacillota bacterium]